MTKHPLPKEGVLYVCRREPISRLFAGQVLTGERACTPASLSRPAVGQRQAINPDTPHQT